MNIVEGNASVYQGNPVSRITFEGRGGGISAAGYPVRGSVHYSADFDVGRRGGAGGLGGKSLGNTHALQL